MTLSTSTRIHLCPSDVVGHQKDTGRSRKNDSQWKAIFGILESLNETRNISFERRECGGILYWLASWSSSRGVFFGRWTWSLVNRYLCQLHRLVRHFLDNSREDRFIYGRNLRKDLGRKGFKIYWIWRNKLKIIAGSKFESPSVITKWLFFFALI